VLVGVNGCGKKPPLVAGGQPVSYWVDALQSPDARLRKQAALKLGNIGPSDSAVVPALIGALHDADTAVRCEAILSMLKLGPDARDAVPALTEVQEKDRDPKVRAYAAKALDKLHEGK
jgi:HEAT repeat protein